MKVRIQYTVDLDDETLAAIHTWMGGPSQPTRDTVFALYYLYGHSLDAEIEFIKRMKNRSGKDVGNL